MQNKPIRPVFKYTDKQGVEYDIKAGGVLFYRSIGKEIEFLMIKNRNIYEDFGGCTDAKDADIFETIAREVDEESNGIFKKKDVLIKLSVNEPICSERSKYLLYIVQLLPFEENIDEKEFGTREIHDNFDRTVEWVPLSKFKDTDFLKMVNFRLKMKGFFAAIFSL